MSKRAERKAPRGRFRQTSRTSSVLVSVELSPDPPPTRTAHATRILEESTMIDLVPRKYHTGTFDPTSLHIFPLTYSRQGCLRDNEQPTPETSRRPKEPQKVA